MAKDTIKATIEREVTDIVEGQIRAMSRVDSEGATRYLRRDRTNDKVYAATLELMKPLTKYERSIVRGLVDKVRIERNTETAAIRRAQRDLLNAEVGGEPFIPRETFTVTARVYQQDQFGNVRSTVSIVAGMEVIDAQSVLDRVRQEDANGTARFVDGKYMRYSFTNSSRRAGADSVWTFTHAQIYGDALDR